MRVRVYTCIHLYVHMHVHTYICVCMYLCTICTYNLNRLISLLDCGRKRSCILLIIDHYKEAWQTTKVKKSREISVLTYYRRTNLNLVLIEFHPVIHTNVLLLHALHMYVHMYVRSEWIDTSYYYLDAK